MDIENLIFAIRNSKIRITDHADEQSVEDNLTFEDIKYSLIHGEVIEDYPNDKPYPSCLIMGKTITGNPIHSVWGYNSNNGYALLITVYRPDPTRWIDWKVRIKK